MSTISRKWVILLPILLGVAIFIFLKQGKAPPVQQEPAEIPKLVRSISIPSLDVVPKAVGHGTVRPGFTWDAVAQVSGKILEKHPKLKKGAIIPVGQPLLRIDPTDFELVITQIKADIQASQAQLQELEAKATNTRAALAIEERALHLNESELQRKKKLIGKGGVSRSDLESQEQTLLAQKQKLQSQENTLNLLPSQKALVEAQLARHQAKLATAERDLQHTKVQMPFTGRIAEVNFEEEQYVRVGEILLEADDLQRAEIEVQIPIEQIAPLMRSEKNVNILNAVQSDSHHLFGITAEVKLNQGLLKAVWQGRVARMSDTLDPKTRTVGVIVEVDEPYANVRPGVRPPLLKGLFVEVTLMGSVRTNSLVIPRLALHDDTVYLVNAQDRLEIRRVEIELLQPEYAVIRSGVGSGEQVVISDLVPAIEGMLLSPQTDEAAQTMLGQQAAAEGVQP
ncbi:efflux RND transporter periplasmic adaptor subunit [bacterium endosymbiont of Escarpia laminata]|nr:MAG: efflux RND transporter periplasmic adaptor subunit [bacterium endosymbiont of Escarpia laminata]